MVRRLVIAAHGSADPRYPAVIEAIAEAVRRELRRWNLPPAEVVIGYLDHCPPALAGLTRAGDVVVPLLLSAGYHSAVDIPAVVADGSVVTPPLGPDPRLAGACADRLREAGWRDGAGPVILTAAGSSDPQASADVAAVAADLHTLLRVEVRPAYLSAASPRLADVVTGAAAVATYLIAPGRFADSAAVTAARSGVPVVSAVLGDHPAIPDIVVDRFRGALPAGDRDVKAG